MANGFKISPRRPAPPPPKGAGLAPRPETTSSATPGFVKANPSTPPSPPQAKRFGEATDFHPKAETNAPLSQLRNYPDGFHSLEEMVGVLVTAQLLESLDKADRKTHPFTLAPHLPALAAGPGLQTLFQSLQGRLPITAQRLEDDIHQTNDPWRSIVELVMNGLDAKSRQAIEVSARNGFYSVKDYGQGMDPATILELLLPKISGKPNPDEQGGRFGIGFYTALSHLKTEADRVVVDTKSTAGAYRLVFRKISDEIVVKTEAVSAAESAPWFNEGTGTRITVQSETLRQAELKKELWKYLRYLPPEKLLVDGRGFSRADLKRVGGRGDAEIFENKAGLRGLFVVKAGDVVIEQYASGAKLPERILQLPYGVDLSITRDQVGITESLRAFLSEQITAADSVAKIHQLLPLAQAWDARHPALEVENSFTEALKQRAAALLAEKPKARVYPDTPGMRARIRSRSAVFLDVALFDDGYLERFVQPGEFLSGDALGSGAETSPLQIVLTEDLQERHYYEPAQKCLYLKRSLYERALPLLWSSFFAIPGMEYRARWRSPWQRSATMMVKPPTLPEEVEETSPSSSFKEMEALEPSIDLAEIETSEPAKVSEDWDFMRRWLDAQEMPWEDIAQPSLGFNDAKPGELESYQRETKIHDRTWIIRNRGQDGKKQIFDLTRGEAALWGRSFQAVLKLFYWRGSYYAHVDIGSKTQAIIDIDTNETRYQEGVSDVRVFSERILVLFEQGEKRWWQDWDSGEKFTFPAYDIDEIFCERDRVYGVLPELKGDINKCSLVDLRSGKRIALEDKTVFSSLEKHPDPSSPILQIDLGTRNRGKSCFYDLRRERLLFPGKFFREVYSTQKIGNRWISHVQDSEGYDQLVDAGQEQILLNGEKFLKMKRPHQLEGSGRWVVQGKDLKKTSRLYDVLTGEPLLDLERFCRLEQIIEFQGKILISGIAHPDSPSGIHDSDARLLWEDHRFHSILVLNDHLIASISDGKPGQTLFFDLTQGSSYLSDESILLNSNTIILKGPPHRRLTWGDGGSRDRGGSYLYDLETKRRLPWLPNHALKNFLLLGGQVHLCFQNWNGKAQSLLDERGNFVAQDFDEMLAGNDPQNAWLLYRKDDVVHSLNPTRLAALLQDPTKQARIEAIRAVRPRLKLADYWPAADVVSEDQWQSFWNHPRKRPLLPFLAYTPYRKFVEAFSDLSAEQYSLAFRLIENCADAFETQAPEAFYRKLHEVMGISLKWNEILSALKLGAYHPDLKWIRLHLKTPGESLIPREAPQLHPLAGEPLDLVAVLAELRSQFAEQRSVEGLKLARPQLENDFLSRNLLHAVNHLQGTNPYAFVRELLQNARDVQSEITDPERRKIDIEAYTVHGDLVVSFRDYHSMSEEEFFASLEPGKSTKRGKQGKVGRFGIGFFSSLPGAHWVRRKAATPDGTQILEVEFLVTRDARGKVTQVPIRIEKRPNTEGFVGTLTETARRGDAGAIEGARFVSAVTEMARYVPQDLTTIRCNGKIANHGKPPLVEEDWGPLGPVKLHDGLENRLLLGGWSLTDLPKELWEGLPEEIREFYERHGFYLDFDPDWVRTTPTRDRFRDHELVMREIKARLPGILIRGFLKRVTDPAYRDDLHRLPEIYFDPTYRLADEATVGAARQDAEKLLRGESSKIDLEKYSIEVFFTVYPFIPLEVDGATLLLSIRDIYEYYHAARNGDPHDRETLEAREMMRLILASEATPPSVKTRLLEQDRRFSSRDRESQIVADEIASGQAANVVEDFAVDHAYPRDKILDPDYRRYFSLLESVTTFGYRRFHPHGRMNVGLQTLSSEIGYYAQHRHDGRDYHYFLSYNQSLKNSVARLKEIAAMPDPEKAWIEFQIEVGEIMKLWSHEWTHVATERPDVPGFTHDLQFRRDWQRLHLEAFSDLTEEDLRAWFEAINSPAPAAPFQSRRTTP